VGAIGIVTRGRKQRGDETMSGTRKPGAKPAWVPPAVKDAGTVGDILKGGGGKMSLETSDTGDIRKPKGQG
jgi:hypothetical protein